MAENNQILKNIDHPHELERLYREDPEAFKKEFALAWEQKSDSPVLKIWYERLYFKENKSEEKATLFQKDFLVMGIIAVLSGIATWLIKLLTDQFSIPTINLVFGIFPFIAAYFIYEKKERPSKRVMITLASLFLFSLLYLNVLPYEQEDSNFLVYLHLPLFLWVLVGVAFTGDQYRKSHERLAYLKFNGEFFILYSGMMIGFVILSILTIQLFYFLKIQIFVFYFDNVFIVGVPILSIVTIYLLTGKLKFTKNVAPFFARIFSPLVLIMLVIYLLSILWVSVNPFLDRDFLLTFNVILLIILAITIFSITERGADKRKNVFDFINHALILLALVINTVALSAIIFRLTSYGISPNRLAVLGSNVLIWIHLFWILFAYIRFFINKTGVTSVQDAITKYLPIYGLWAAFVTFMFPLIFQY